MLSNRKPLEKSPPGVQPKPGLVHQVRSYRLITPLYGGGAETQKPDEVTVVRASEIRGLLRFWWRAIRGGQFHGSLEAMRSAEEAIWGSAAGEDKAGPSPVALAVKVTNRGREWRNVTIRPGGKLRQIGIGDPRSPYGYVAFPLREGGQGVWKDVAFDVGLVLKRATVRVDGQTFNVKEEVEAALWAWETFGGVGARTRRGFGALKLVALKENGQPKIIDNPSSSHAEEWITTKLSAIVVGETWPPSIPHISQRPLMVCTKREGTAIAAWQYLIRKLRAFRQKRHKKCGLSLWPEANVIRRIHGLSLKWPPNVSNPKLAEKFPRAHFGLPIIFHMPHDRKLKKDFTLRGQSPSGSDKPIERLASPLILRPLACRDGYVGLAIVLDTLREPPYGVEVDGFPANKKQVRADLTKFEAGQEPLRRVLNGETDVLQAFLKTLR
jgi:CRISPR-associated protein Cmr1